MFSSPETIMKNIVLILFFLFPLEAYSTETTDISDAIKWLVRTNHRHQMWTNIRARSKIAEWILSAAIEQRLDPYLLIGMAYHESTFRPGVIGALGEVGLIQVAKHVRLECECDGYDMVVPLDQLRCGARHLRRMIDRCGSLRSGLTAYASAPPRCSEVEGDRVWMAVNIRVSKMRRLRERPWRNQ